MQSHKRPHELSDILLKNLISACRGASYLISNRRLSSTRGPISEAAIIPKRLSLSSDRFQMPFNSLTLSFRPCQRRRILPHLVDLSIGCFHRLIQAIVFKSLFLLVMNPHQLTLAFSLEIVRGRGAHFTHIVVFGKGCFEINLCPLKIKSQNISDVIGA